MFIQMPCGDWINTKHIARVMSYTFGGDTKPHFMVVVVGDGRDACSESLYEYGFETREQADVARDAFVAIIHAVDHSTHSIVKNMVRTCLAAALTATPAE